MSVLFAPLSSASAYGNAKTRLMAGQSEGVYRASFRFEVTVMSDNPQDRGPRDRSRISLEQEHEVRYWSMHFGITEQELREAVAKVGNSAEAVMRELGKATEGSS